MYIHGDSRGEVLYTGYLRGEVCMYRVIREGKYIYRVI